MATQLFARHVLGFDTDAELQALAQELLAAGRKERVIASIAAGDFFDDNIPKFWAALGLVLPSRAQATWTLLAPYIEAIAEGRVAPYAGMRSMMDELWGAADLFDAGDTLPGDHFGLGDLYRTYYDDTIDDAEQAAALLAQAKDWCVRYDAGGPRRASG